MEPVVAYDSKQTTSIVGSEYCVPDEVAFRVDTKLVSLEKYVLNASNEKENMNWKIKMYRPIRIGPEFLVLDTQRKVIMTLKNTNPFYYPRWKVYKGESTNEKDLLFTVKRPGLFFNRDLEIYLPSTKEENGNWDFKVKAHKWRKEFTIHSAECMIARGRLGNGWFESEFYNVNVSPNVDYAFVVALTVLYNEMVANGVENLIGDNRGRGSYDL